jgi:hypothetical protein
MWETHKFNARMRKKIRDHLLPKGFTEEQIAWLSQPFTDFYFFKMFFRSKRVLTMPDFTK